MTCISWIKVIMNKAISLTLARHTFIKPLDQHMKTLSFRAICTLWILFRMVDSSARNRTNCFLMWSPSFLSRQSNRHRFGPKSKIKWTVQLYLNLAKKKKKEQVNKGQWMHKEFLLRWNPNGILQICTLILGKVYPQFLVE